MATSTSVVKSIHRGDQNSCQSSRAFKDLGLSSLTGKPVPLERTLRSSGDATVVSSQHFSRCGITVKHGFTAPLLPHNSCLWTRICSTVYYTVYLLFFHQQASLSVLTEWRVHTLACQTENVLWIHNFSCFSYVFTPSNTMIRIIVQVFQTVLEIHCYFYQETVRSSAFLTSTMGRERHSHRY